MHIYCRFMNMQAKEGGIVSTFDDLMVISLGLVDNTNRSSPVWTFLDNFSSAHSVFANSL
jgi:hypothetical protein